MIANLKVLKPIQFSAFQFYKEFRSAASDSNDEWEKRFKITHRNWDSGPSWNKTISLSAKLVEFTTETDDAHDGKIYRFLNYGTKKRYAAMPSGWKSKTAPGRFFPNAGGVPFDRRARGAWDWREYVAASRAIDPRAWDKMVKKQTERKVVVRFREAMQKGVVNSGHKYGK